MLSYSSRYVQLAAQAGVPRLDASVFSVVPLSAYRYTVIGSAVPPPGAGLSWIREAAMSAPKSELFDELTDSIEFVQVKDALHPDSSIAHIHCIFKREQTADGVTTYFVGDVGTCVTLNGARLYSGWTPLFKHDLLHFHERALDHCEFAFAETCSDFALDVAQFIAMKRRGEVPAAVASPPPPPPSSAAAAAAAAASPPAAAAAAAAAVSRKRSHEGTDAAAAKVARTDESAASSMAAVAEAFTCCLCTDMIAGCTTLSCGHPFCNSCISGWFARIDSENAAKDADESADADRRSHTCPECITVHAGPLTLVPSTDKVVAILVAQLGVDEQAAFADRMHKAKAGMDVIKAKALKAAKTADARAKSRGSQKQKKAAAAGDIDAMVSDALVSSKKKRSHKKKEAKNDDFIYSRGDAFLQLKRAMTASGGDKALAIQWIMDRMAEPRLDRVLFQVDLRRRLDAFVID